MLTSYAEVLETVTGQRIEFDSIPVQARPAVQPILSASQTESVDAEISKLLAKSVIRISGMSLESSYLPYLLYLNKTDRIA